MVRLRVFHHFWLWFASATCRFATDHQLDRLLRDTAEAMTLPMNPTTLLDHKHGEVTLVR
ncbi:hypothetical protein [Congregicoccus parvus]|uniref:hypothetical protein n=1 Tax=Congregicoccus parvus TaxID=3081749 RepID=UPI003FA5E3FA